MKHESDATTDQSPEIKTPDPFLSLANSFVDPYGLLFGIPLGEQQGEAATQYWADQYVATGNATYAVLGGLSSLWTRDTSSATALTLGGGYALAGWAAKTGPCLARSLIMLRTKEARTSFLIRK